MKTEQEIINEFIDMPQPLHDMAREIATLREQHGELLAALEAGYSDLRTRLNENAQVAFLMSADDAARYVDKAWPVLDQMRAAIAKATGAVQRETMPDGTTVSLDLSDW